MIRFTRFVVVSLALVLLPLASAQAAVVATEDFESYTPTTNWLPTPGVEGWEALVNPPLVITATDGDAGSQGLYMVEPWSQWAEWSEAPNITVTPNIIYSYDTRVRAGTNTVISQNAPYTGQENFPNTGPAFIATGFAGPGNAANWSVQNNAGETPLPGTPVRGTWYTVDLELDYSTLMARGRFGPVAGTPNAWTAWIPMFTGPSQTLPLQSFLVQNGAQSGGPGTDFDNFMVTVNGPTPTSNWTGTAGDNIWNNTGNWTGSLIPDTNASIAGLGDGITTATAISTNTPTLMRGIVFGGDSTVVGQASYTIGGGANTLSLVADLGTGALPVVFVEEGSHNFTVNVAATAALGVFVSNGASLAFDGPVNLNGNTLTKAGGGTMSINGVNTGGGSVLVSGGVVNGTGTISGDLTNSGGTVAPGLSPGTLSVTGDYDQTGGSLLIEINGLVSDTDYDVLDVTGNLTISGGSLDVVVGFAASPGDSFDILNGLTIDTSGATLNLPVLGPGLVWDTSALDTTGILSLAVLGDFNGDGFVNTADFDIMKTNWFTTGNDLNTNGEVTGDGLVNLDDFSLFKDTLFVGPASALASNVPEPSSLVLLLAVVPAWLVYRPRKKA